MSELVEVLNTAAANAPEAAVTVGGSWALARLLGPSVHAVGSVFGDFTDFRMRNLLGLNEKVAKRLNEDDDPAHTVHPRVAKAVLDEGSWIADDLHQEYLAGLMVSARSQDGASDAGAYLARIVTNLTAEQVRLHYATIAAYAGYWDGAGEVPFPFGQKQLWRRHGVRVELDEVRRLFPHFDESARGLVREGILQDFGRPSKDDLLGNPVDERYTAIIPDSLAWRILLKVLAPNRKLGEAALLVARDRLVTNAGAALVTYPDPEPELFQTATIHDFGLLRT